MKGSSLDAIKSVLNEITDNNLTPSKETIYTWINNLYGELIKMNMKK